MCFISFVYDSFEVLSISGGCKKRSLVTSFAIHNKPVSLHASILVAIDSPADGLTIVNDDCGNSPSFCLYSAFTVYPVKFVRDCVLREKAINLVVGNF